MVTEAAMKLFIHKPEMMDGANQYYCQVCKCKCDAERSVSFRKRPEVLNIQLARYTYDFRTGNKKKLMDPVLLPRILSIPGQENETLEATPYVLCAVQNHRGKSALTGHYVAEAMDWASGTWFEYDDERVSLLKDGPTSSYDLGDDLKGANGTSDAYNLFYVKQGCLSHSVKKQLRQSCNDEKGILQQINDQRIAAFNLKRE